MRYSILTFGCQMNVRDSEVLAGMLEGMGYQQASDIEHADVVVVNTCCVRESAERRIMGRLADLNRLKKANPSVTIAVGGCMAQEPGMAERIRKRLPHIDLVFGTSNMQDLPRLLETVLREKFRVFEVPPCEAMELGCEAPVGSRRGPGVTAYVTVMYGCNNFCSYCIVPYVRGRERSRAPSAIIAEVKEAVARGFKEVMLLGQNVNSYGKGTGGTTFSGLLRMVDGVEGIERIRYMTSHPRDFTADMIEVVADSRHVCEHFHLPIQSGSDRVLGLMGRGYTRDEYISLVDRVRSKLPGASVTTDIIVGFPGETDRDFEDTLDLVRTVRFDMAYTFMFSPRTGTKAAGMQGQIPIEERRRRLSALAREINPIALAINESLVGTTQEVLFEGPSQKDPSVATGRIRTNKIVLVRGGDLTPGVIAPVRISRARTWTLEAEPASG